MSSISRKKFIGILAGAPLAGSMLQGKTMPVSESGVQLHQIDKWGKTFDRRFLGGDVWANPMEDWVVKNGWAECEVDGGNRNIHALSYQVTQSEGDFAMSVDIGLPVGLKQDNGGGFRIGSRADINDHRANVFSKNGLNIGIQKGKLFIGSTVKAFAQAVKGDFVSLSLEGKTEGGQFKFTAKVKDGDVLLAEAKGSAPVTKIQGNIALTSQALKGGNSKNLVKAYSFRNWYVGGSLVESKPNQEFGPILWSQYTLSDNRNEQGYVMKMGALVGPFGEKDSQEVELHIQEGSSWKKIATEAIDPSACIAMFRVNHWDASNDVNYKLIYRERFSDGTTEPYEWAGRVKADPKGRPLRLAGLTCQKDYGFPYAPVADNVAKLDPDLIYFSGDQLYEGHGGYGLIRDPADAAILNYLRKFWQHGWSFREAMRNAPTLSIPDDHDVFHGNIWGENGAAIEDKENGLKISQGGYREPAKMVNVVHKTNCGHHPDFHDTAPILQGITVWYGDMLYGGVNFAVIADRMFKSSPHRVNSESDIRADHIVDPEFDMSKIDTPGLQFLGQRQEEFLKEWSEDQRGHSMKVLLSATVFSGVATHHGKYDGYLRGDLDSGGWPQSGRNRAIELIKAGKALHVNGDQHLTTLSQYGVEKQRDASWSFCTPAIAAGYPRWWRPSDVAGMDYENRPKHGLPETGEYNDGFGNKTYVYAVGYPEDTPDGDRYEVAHKKGSGFGMITIDSEKKTYHLECFRFSVDATDGKASNQFSGFPVTIHQKENAGDNVIG